MKLKVTLLSISIGLLATFASHAGVSIRNGNYYTSFKDLYFPGGFEPKIVRAYNSKSGYRGAFGWGWASEYEAYLSIQPDGSVTLHEYGGGADNRFFPLGFSQNDVAQAVSQIMAAAKATGSISNPKVLAQYQQKLKRDAHYRSVEWAKYLKLGKVKARAVKVGARLVSTKYGTQYLTRVKNGYTRVFETGKVEFFDERGRLVKVTDKNKNYINLHYGKDGRVAKIVDNFNRKLYFTYQNLGLLEKVNSEDGMTCEYKYNSQGELIWSKDAGKNTYSYKYSTDSRHNLTEIGYQDGSKFQLGYYPLDKGEMIAWVKERDGSRTDYTYTNGNGSSAPALRVSSVSTDALGKPLLSTTYDYWFKYKATGEEWIYRLSQNVAGEQTDTIYDQRTGLPLSIKKASGTTQFAYDNAGRMIRKVTPRDRTEISYDPKAGKINKVTTVRGKKTEWSQYWYDPAGNLIFAKNSDKRAVKLVYDANGRVRSLIDQSNRQINFKYNEQSRPVEISDPKVGKIQVEYTNTGEIKKVDSPSGRAVASQVGSAFQGLLELIRPAGVSLNF